MERKVTIPMGASRKRAIELAVRVLNALPVDKAWNISIEKVSHARTSQQNAYLFAVPYKLLSDHTGFDKEELHEFFCGSYFGWRDKRLPKTPRNPSGYTSVPLRTTTRNERGERNVLEWRSFSDFVDYIQRFAADKCGIIIPDPDPQWREKAA